MDCEQAKALISAELDGELADGDRSELDRHLATCRVCGGLAVSLKEQDGSLRRVFAGRREAAVAVAERVIAQLRATALPIDPPRRTAPAVAGRIPLVPMALAAAAGFLIATLLFRPWQRPVPLVSQSSDPEHQSQPVARQDEPDPPDSRAPTSPELAHDSQRDRAPVAITDVHPVQEPAVPAPQKTAAELVVAMGAIQVLPPDHDEWEEMRTGSTIPPGTRVRTGPQGRCEFRTPDGSEVRLNVNTELEFESGRSLKLAQGQAWSTVAEDDEPYRVHVPREQATVTALGTQFDIACTADATVLTVVEGVTRVEGRAGQGGVEVRASERAKIVGGAVADKRRVSDLVIATSWVHEILKLKGAGNVELRRRMDDLFAQIGASKLEHMYEQEIVALGDHCVVPLTRFIQSARSKGDRAKRVRAASILAQIAQPWSVPDLIDLLDDKDADVRYHVAAALQRLTQGETQGCVPEDWRQQPEDLRASTIQKWQLWWQKNKDNYPANPFEPSQAPKLKKGFKA